MIDRPSANSEIADSRRICCRHCANPLMREYAARAGIAVVGVEYSLAPGAKCPQPIAETAGVVAWRGVAWLRQHGSDYGIGGARPLLGGDSAGANLSVATSLWLRQHDQPPVMGMLLN